MFTSGTSATRWKTAFALTSRNRTIGVRQLQPQDKLMNIAKPNQKRVAVVTGASSGIGLAITTALLERGYSVVGNSRTISKSAVLHPSADLVLVDGDIATKETSIKV